MQKWEYKFVRWSLEHKYTSTSYAHSFDGLEEKGRHGLDATDRINELGLDGWELVSTELLTELTTRNSLLDKKILFTFKRPLQE